MSAATDRTPTPCRHVGFLVGTILILTSLYGLTLPRGLTHGPTRYCSTNLREIGLAMTLYAQRYNAYPEGTGATALDALRTKGKPPVLKDADELVVCPHSDVQPGPTAITYRGPRFRLVEGRIDYTTPISCDRPENHAGGGINVLYHSGRVDHVLPDTDEYRRVLDQTRE